VDFPAVDWLTRPELSHPHIFSSISCDRPKANGYLILVADRGRKIFGKRLKQIAVLRSRSHKELHHSLEPAPYRNAAQTSKQFFLFAVQNYQKINHAKIERTFSKWLKFVSVSTFHHGILYVFTLLFVGASAAVILQPEPEPPN
jgi:hypothetical protein